MAKEEEASIEDQKDDEDLDLIEEYKAREGLVSGYGYPQDKPKDSIFNFFKYLIGRGDSKKIGNLSKVELGPPLSSVRGLYSISLFSDVLGLAQVRNFYNMEAENILATSTSFKGFYPQLFVTDIRKIGRIKPKEDKKKWFAGKEDKPEERAES